MDGLIVNPTALTVVPQALPGHPRGPHASFVVKASWQVAPGSEAVPLPQPVIGGAVPLGDQPDSGLARPDELAPFKPVAEVLWLGSCHAPGGTPVPALRARLRLGPVDKEIAVFGERSWKDLTAATPFTSLPLSWDRAYGGPAIAANPSGTGASKDSPPPLLEHPKQLVMKPGSKVPPIGFGPINPLWPGRDAILKQTQVPPGWHQQQPRRIPASFDWRFFCDAPADQQLPGYLRGDELLRLGCAHPAAADWQLPLPGIRPRLLLRDVDASGANRDREVPLQLDTVIYDGDGHLLSLLWRGLLPITTPDLEPIRHIALQQEALADEPAPLATLLSLLSLLDVEEAREAAAVAPPPYEPPTRHAPFLHQTPPDGPWTLDQLHAYVADGGSLVGAVLRGSMLRGARLAGADLSGADLKGCDLSGADLAGAKLVGADARGATLAGADLSGADCSQASLIQVQAAGVDLSGARLDGAILQEGRFDGADCSAASMVGSNAYHASLIGIRAADLIATDAVFDHANLRQATLTRASLSGASLSEAELIEADLSAATAEGSVLSNCFASRIVLADAKLAGAILAGSTMDHSDCRRADLSGADCTAVIWRDSRLDEVVLAGAVCTKAELLRCTLARAQAAGANFDEARLDEIEAPGIDCSGGSFFKTSLNRAKTPGATFTDAAFVGTRARGWEAEDLQAAGLRASDHCDFTGARLSRMQSPGSSWRQCALCAADLSGAVMPGADLSKSLLSRTRLRCADLAGVVWVGATLEHVDLRHAKLTAAIFLQASCSDCLFTDAVMVGAELGDARFERCFFDRARLAGTTHA